MESEFNFFFKVIHEVSQSHFFITKSMDWWNVAIEHLGSEIIIFLFTGY